METIEQSDLCRRFSRALLSYDEHAKAQQTICRHLIGLLPKCGKTEFNRALEIGCGSGGFTRLLQRHCSIREWTINDLCEDCQSVIQDLFVPAQPPLFLPGNAEQQSFQGNYDLIASASAFQWMQDLPVFFQKLARLISPDGILLFNTFAPGNLKEIQALTGKGLIYPPANQLCQWLAPDFHLIHTEEETITLTFRHPLDVLKHLKYTGVTATGTHINWTPGRQRSFCSEYIEAFSTINNQVTLTYQPLYILAVKK